MSHNHKGVLHGDPCDCTELTVSLVTCVIIKTASTPMVDQLMKQREQVIARSDKAHEEQLRALHGIVDQLMKQRAETDATIALAMTGIAFELATSLEEFKRGQTRMMTAQEVLLFSAVQVAFNGMRAIVDRLQPTTGSVPTPTDGSVH